MSLFKQASAIDEIVRDMEVAQTKIVNANEISVQEKYIQALDYLSTAVDKLEAAGRKADADAVFNVIKTAAGPKWKPKWELPKEPPPGGPGIGREPAPAFDPVLQALKEKEKIKPNPVPKAVREMGVDPKVLQELQSRKEKQKGVGKLTTQPMRTTPVKTPLPDISISERGVPGETVTERALGYLSKMHSSDIASWSRALYYLRSVLKGSPNPDIYPNGPTSVVKFLAGLPRNELIKVYKQHLDDVGISPKQIEEAITSRTGFAKEFITPEERKARALKYKQEHGGAEEPEQTGGEIPKTWDEVKKYWEEKKEERKQQRAEPGWEDKKKEREEKKLQRAHKFEAPTEKEIKELERETPEAFRDRQQRERLQHWKEREEAFSPSAVRVKRRNPQTGEIELVEEVPVEFDTSLRNPRHVPVKRIRRNPETKELEIGKSKDEPEEKKPRFVNVADPKKVKRAVEVLNEMNMNKVDKKRYYASMSYLLSFIAGNANLGAFKGIADDNRILLLKSLDRLTAIEAMKQHLDKFGKSHTKLDAAIAAGEGQEEDEGETPPKIDVFTGLPAVPLPEPTREYREGDIVFTPKELAYLKHVRKLFGPKEEREAELRIARERAGNEPVTDETLRERIYPQKPATRSLEEIEKEIEEARLKRLQWQAEQQAKLRQIEEETFGKARPVEEGNPFFQEEESLEKKLKQRQKERIPATPSWQYPLKKEPGGKLEIVRDEKGAWVRDPNKFPPPPPPVSPKAKLVEPELEPESEEEDLTWLEPKEAYNNYLQAIKILASVVSKKKV